MVGIIVVWVPYQNGYVTSRTHAPEPAKFVTQLQKGTPPSSKTLK